MSSFVTWVVMLCDHLFNGTPFVEGVLTDLVYAGWAQIFDLSLVWVAHCTKVLKVNVDYQVFGNNFVFVFADVFGAQLHLACLNVVTTLNESCVEHDPEHHFVRKSSVLKHNLDVALKRQAFFLLISEQKDDSWLLLTVELLRWVSELLSNVEASTAVNFEEGNTASA